jgi:glycosyltransferase involved in cell wall biosynthesis
MSNVLIISPEPWDTNQVSKHHYARTLAKRGHRVFFLDPPLQGGSTLTITRVPGEEGEIHVLRGPRVAGGLRFMPAWLRRALERRWLAQLERRVGAHIDIVWLFENSRFYDLSFAGDRIKIYHQVDLNQDFHVQAAASSADISFAVSDVIRDRVARYTRNVVKIPHGVLDMQVDGTVPFGKIRPGRPAAAYIGNLDIAYLDTRLLCDLVAGSTEVDFHLIGSFTEGGELQRLLNLESNVFFWGRVPSNELPGILAKMDVMLIVYDAKRHRQQLANPHKILDYMKSGKVTVATYTDEYKSLAGDLIVMVEDQEQFPAAFRVVVGELPRWNSAELSARRKAFASDNTYDRQIERISRALSRCPGIRHRFGDIAL